jgi:AraC family transcriptional regulator
LHSSGDRWPGVWLREVAPESAGEFPESYLLEHELVLQTSSLCVNELYRPRTGWTGIKSAAGLVNFMPRGTSFASRWDERLRVLSMTLSPSFVRTVEGHDSSRSLDSPPHINTEDRLLAAILFALRDDIRERSPVGNVYGEQLATAMVSHMLRRWGAGRADRLAGRTQASSKKFERTIDYIHAHLESELSVSALARIVDLGTDHFIRSFRRSMGVTPHQYVLQCRIARAKALLVRPRASIKRVAMQCGFPDPSHFIKVFRRITGVTPALYRDQRFW